MEQLLGLIVVIKYRDGKIYAINHGSLLCINLLYKICLICKLKFVATKAKLHVNEIAEKQDISVLGKVFWYSVLL